MTNFSQILAAIKLSAELTLVLFGLSTKLMPLLESPTLNPTQTPATCYFSKSYRMPIVNSTLFLYSSIASEWITTSSSGICGYYLNQLGVASLPASMSFCI
jgi:hypothetical protein